MVTDEMVKAALTVYWTPWEPSLPMSSPDRMKRALVASIEQLGEELAKMIEGYSADQIRLAAGEMTAQEMRTVKAVQRWWAAAIRHKCGVV